MEDRNNRNSLFWPIIFLGLGIFLLLNSMGYFNYTPVEILLRLWPLLFIAGGIDNIYRGESFVGAAVAVGGGSLFLLGNFGYLDADALALLIRYWPVLLIAFGLDLLIGRRSAKGGLIGVLLGLAIVAGLVWLAARVTTGSAAAPAVEVSYPLQGASEANIKLESVAGRLNIARGAGKNNLAEGSLILASSERLEDDFSVVDGQANLSLHSEGLFYFVPFAGQTSQAGWDLRLSDLPEINLAGDMVFGEQVVDLTGLKINRLNLKSVFGRNELILPAGKRLEGEVSVVFGETIVHIPRGAQVEITLNSAFTSVRLPVELDRSGSQVNSREGSAARGDYHLKIDAPFGIVRIEMED